MKDMEIEVETSKKKEI